MPALISGPGADASCADADPTRQMRKKRLVIVFIPTSTD
jgi:hypothetical protein